MSPSLPPRRHPNNPRFRKPRSRPPSKTREGISRQLVETSELATLRLLEQLRDPNQAREAEEAEAANVAVKEEKEAEEATAAEKEEKEKKVKQEPVEVEEAIVKDAVAKGLKVKQVNSGPELDRVKAEAVVEEIDPKAIMLSPTKLMLMRT